MTMAQIDILALEPTDRLEATQAIQNIMWPLEGRDPSPSARVVWMTINSVDLALSRTDLEQATGLAHATVHGAVEFLHEEGLIEEVKVYDQHTRSLYRSVVDDD